MGKTNIEKKREELIKKLSELDEIGLIMMQNNADILLMRMKLAQLEDKKEKIVEV